jgi:hypothetical protein
MKHFETGFTHTGYVATAFTVHLLETDAIEANKV